VTRLRATLWATAERIAEIDPWLIVVGYFLGAIVAFVMMVRV
jgi:hypothetical protein